MWEPARGAEVPTRPCQPSPEPSSLQLHPRASPGHGPRNSDSDLRGRKLCDLTMCQFIVFCPLGIKEGLWPCLWGRQVGREIPHRIGRCGCETEEEGEVATSVGPGRGKRHSGGLLRWEPRLGGEPLRAGAPRDSPEERPFLWRAWRWHGGGMEVGSRAWKKGVRCKGVSWGLTGWQRTWKGLLRQVHDSCGAGWPSQVLARCGPDTGHGSWWQPDLSALGGVCVLPLFQHTPHLLRVDQP